MRHARLTSALLASACLAAVCVVVPFARALAAKDAAGADRDVSAVVPTNRRTVAAHGAGSVSYPADTCRAVLHIDSGMSTADAAPAKIEALLTRVQGILAAAALPAAEPSGDTWVGPGALPGKVVAARDYQVAVDSLATARRVVQVLAPITDRTDTATESAKLTSVYASAHSSKFDADPEAAHAEARRLALTNARAEAAQTAAVLGMRLGPPVTVGLIRVTDTGTDAATHTGCIAGVDVLFELVE